MRGKAKDLSSLPQICHAEIVRKINIIYLILYSLIGLLLGVMTFYLVALFETSLPSNLFPIIAVTFSVILGLVPVVFYLGRSLSSIKTILITLPIGVGLILAIYYYWLTQG